MSSEAGRQVEALVADFAARRPLRAGSFIATIYGDAVAPRGGELALTSLLRLLAELGVSETLVRTAISRRAQEGWLAPRRSGRRSFYRLTEAGRHDFGQAARRIYGGPPQGWDGQWCLVLVPGGAGEARERLRRRLRWLGFGEFAPGALLHPLPDRAALDELLAGPEGAAAVAVEGRSLPGLSDQPPRRLVEQSWNLEALTADYRAFLQRFGPLEPALAADRPSPRLCLLLRLLLIHDYRRVILRDPLLPPALLPEDWIGAAAHRLAARLYLQVRDPAEAWIDATFETENGPLPPPEPGFFRRFEGVG